MGPAAAINPSLPRGAAAALVLYGSYDRASLRSTADQKALAQPPREAAMTPFRPTASCPLDGITVLDLSRLVAGNMVSLQLADFGAEVIKVEDPDKGDPLRAWRVEGHSLFWKAYARNKLSLTLNLRTARGRDLLLALIEGSREIGRASCRAGVA